MSFYLDLRFPKAVRSSNRYAGRGLSVLAVAGALLAYVLPARAAEGWAWAKTGDTVALLAEGQTVWRFNYGPAESKPNFHPVAVPGGPVLTWDKPADHPWHRALWFSWKFINGVNYWEEDPKTGRPAGKTQWQRVAVETTPDFTARIAFDLSYQRADTTNGQPVVREHRVIEVSRPDAQGQYYLDWTMTFKALASDAIFDRTPLPNEPEGKPYGGYAGLSVRLAEALRDRQALTVEAPVVFSQGRYRGKAAALDYSGVIDGRAAGVAIVDHPQNLNAPSPWYAINDGAMYYFSPAVLCYGPYTLKAGQSFTLRYRVVAHPERWDLQRLRGEVERYTSGR